MILRRFRKTIKLWPAADILSHALQAAGNGDFIIVQPRRSKRIVIEPLVAAQNSLQEVTLLIFELPFVYPF
ncbi:hypothetical protein D3C77_626710 [compost metagenome]